MKTWLLGEQTDNYQIKIANCKMLLMVPVIKAIKIINVIRRMNGVSMGIEETKKRSSANQWNGGIITIILTNKRMISNKERIISWNSMMIQRRNTNSSNNKSNSRLCCNNPNYSNSHSSNRRTRRATWNFLLINLNLTTPRIISRKVSCLITITAITTMIALIRIKVISMFALL